MKVTPGRIIAITGIDGSGKSTLAAWLQEELVRRGLRPAIRWSRFNNYLSKPFLLVTKLTGHNFYEVNSGIRMGYHNFEGFPGPLKWLFISLQCMDVNVATFFKLTLPSRGAGVTICERGPWDTVVDVYADTQVEALLRSSLSGCFVGQLRGRSSVILIDRDIDRIYRDRPELEFDHKLKQRKQAYLRLAESRGWTVLDNNGTLEEAKSRLRAEIDRLGY